MTTTAEAGDGTSVRPGAPAHLVQSADHALTLLRAVARRGSLRVAEAAILLEVVPSTAHRLLSTLAHQGFVLQERRGGAYLPGPTITELVGSSNGIDLRAAARPMLDWLRDQTRETASIMILEGNEVRFLDSIDGSRSVRVSARTGVVLPAHCTSGGKVLLAALDQDELRRRYPDERLVARSPRSITTWGRLDAELAEVRRRGYATNFEEGDADIGAVSVAVRPPRGEGAVAALCVAAPLARLRTKRAAGALLPVLRSGRDQLELALAVGSA
jgi:DNA-binding IclR family transcriptional regulator